MNRFFKLIKEYAVTIAFIVFLLAAKLFHYQAAEQLSKSFWDFFIEMLIFIPLMFILIGLFDVWVPKDKIQKHIGDNSGPKGILLVVVLAMLQAGPLYGAFPVAYILWKKGCSIRNVFIYLGAFSTLKIPMMAFEIGFLGFKFSILRTVITLPLFIIISEIMARYLKNREFTMHTPEDKK